MFVTWLFQFLIFIAICGVGKAVLEVAKAIVSLENCIRETTKA